MFNVTKDGYYHVDGWIAFSAGSRGKAVLSMELDRQYREFGENCTFQNVMISTCNAYMIMGNRVVLHLQDPFTNALFCIHEL